MALGAILLGCSSPDVPIPEKSADNVKKEIDKTETRSITSAGGHVSVMDPGKTERVPLFDISWETATLEYSSDQQFGGSLKNVKGTLYQDGEKSATFVAPAAVAERGTLILRIKGGVTVTALKEVFGKVGPGKLTCNEIVYDGQKGIIDAQGGIDLHDHAFFVSGVDHIRIKMEKGRWTEIGTPDMVEDSK